MCMYMLKQKKKRSCKDIWYPRTKWEKYKPPTSSTSCSWKVETTFLHKRNSRPKPKGRIFGEDKIKRKASLRGKIQRVKLERANSKSSTLKKIVEDKERSKHKNFVYLVYLHQTLWVLNPSLSPALFPKKSTFSPSEILYQMNHRNPIQGWFV